ncbi:MAG: ATP-binding protein [Alphaproteobacteria bacterium]|nr:ATP-binding protein [Alphaproteobacteria bacterium]
MGIVQDRSLSFWTAEFRDRDTEARYRGWRYDERLIEIRIVAVIAILAAIPFVQAAHLRLGAGPEFGWLAALRTGTAILTALGLALTWRRLTYRTLDALVLAIVLVVCAQTFLLSIIGGPKVLLLEVQYITIIMAIHIFVPNRFLFNAVPCLALSFAFGFQAFWTLDYVPSQQIGVVSWLIAANVLGMITAQRLARYRRGQFANLEAEQQANVQMRAAMEEAELASRAKSEFLANISHELRTPLNAINGFSELMLNSAFGPIGDRRYQAYVKDINASGQHLLSLINEILDLSRIEAGKREISEAHVDLRRLIASCLRVVRQRADDKGISLENRSHDDMPILWADETALKQVMLNLIVNGIKFTPAGGSVAVSVEHADDGIALVVSDTGIGIAPQDSEAVLKPFAQVDNALTREQDGTGLGLPLAKALTELHGGKLMIESALNEGTTVRVWLPADRVVARSDVAAVEQRASA